MILADTSIWIDHLRAGNKEMGKQLNQGHIVIHPLIIAELALGSLRERTLQERTKTLALLDCLPQVRVAQLSEVRLMIEARRLYSLGIGLTDAHLIASVFINASTLLWTRDKRLRKAAEDLGIHVKWPLYRVYTYSGYACHESEFSGSRQVRYGVLPKQIKTFCDHNECGYETFRSTRAEVRSFILRMLIWGTCGVKGQAHCAISLATTPSTPPRLRSGLRQKRRALAQRTREDGAASACSPDEVRARRPQDSRQDAGATRQ